MAFLVKGTSVGGSLIVGIKVYCMLVKGTLEGTILVEVFFRTGHFDQGLFVIGNLVMGILAVGSLEEYILLLV